MRRESQLIKTIEEHLQTLRNAGLTQIADKFTKELNEAIQEDMLDLREIK